MGLTVGGADRRHLDAVGVGVDDEQGGSVIGTSGDDDGVGQLRGGYQLLGALEPPDVPSRRAVVCGEVGSELPGSQSPAVRIVLPSTTPRRYFSCKR